MQQVLGELALELGPGFCYLEIGFGAGRSLEQVLPGKPSKVTIVDAFNRTYGGTITSEDGCRERLARIGIPKTIRVRVIAKESARCLPELCREETQSWDLVLVDGDHSRTGAASDLELACHLVKPKGFLVFDDLDHPSHGYLRLVWNEWLENHPEFAGKTLPGGHGFGIALRRENGE
jgi:hypothetical protein